MAVELTPSSRAVEVASASILLHRVADMTVAVDTTIAIPAGADVVEVDLTVRLSDPSETFRLSVALLTAENDTAFVSDPEEVTLGAAQEEPLVLQLDLRFAWEAIDAGDLSTCALGAGGRAFCWGRNERGQLGGSTADSSAVPVPVAGDLRFAALTVGGRGACGLLDDGAAHCWGSNDRGQLGDGSPTDAGAFRSQPGPVAGGLHFATVTLGFGHACAIDGQGVTHCWGANNLGQLGAQANETCLDGSVPCSTVPIRLTAVTGLEQVSAGILETCGLDGAGTAHCSTLDASIEFLPFAGPAGVRFQTVSAGAGYQCVLGSDDQVYCWGELFNTAGQQGNGTVEPMAAPTPVSGGMVFTSVHANHANSVLTHTCALAPTGSAYCWGYNEFDQLGAASADVCSFNNVDYQCALVPVPVETDLRFTFLAVGGRHTCGLTDDRRLHCWGDNTFGQLGDGTFVGAATPVEVSAPAG